MVIIILWTPIAHFLIDYPLYPVYILQREFIISLIYALVLSCLVSISFFFPTADINCVIRTLGRQHD